MRRYLPVVLLAAFWGGGMAEAGAQRPSRATGLTGNGRQLDPAGRLTPTGTFPLAGAISPDGKSYWTVDGGRHTAYVHVVDLKTGSERQRLPIPGGNMGIAFASDGRHAYVSGLAGEDEDQRTLKGPDGDVIHVYEIAADGTANEQAPISLPDGRDGAAAQDNLPPASGVKSWPQGLALTPDGKTLVVVLGQADQVAVVDLATRKADLVDVGRYPYAVAIDPRRPRAYVTSERDGTVEVLDLKSRAQIGSIPVAGAYSHPEGLAVDPRRDLLYVAVTDRDLMAVVDLAALKLERTVDIGRPEAGVGVAPVAVALARDGRTAYVSDAGEDAVAAVALEDRPARPVRIAIPRSVRSIRRYRRAIKHVHSRRRRARLQRRLLYGRVSRGCAGPTVGQDRRAARKIVRAPTRRRARRARRSFPGVLRCTGVRFGAKAFTVIGRIPTASYTTDVDVSPDGRHLVWLAARGVGSGPNASPPIGIDYLNQGAAGVLPVPTDRRLARLTRRADRAVVPSNAQDPPPNTPVRSGGPIEHVFYVVKENRTYDQVMGDDPRGEGDPSLVLFGDNGSAPPGGGVTPNVHALAREFPLLDNVYANSEESTMGHKVTAGAYANDYTQRKVAAGRSRKGDPDIFAIGVPPRAFVFDQAARQGVSFRAYGELGAGNQPFANDGRDTFATVAANTDYAYPSQVQGTCRSPVTAGAPLPNSARCTADSADLVSTTSGHSTSGPPNAQSRMRVFQTEFDAQVASGTVPRFNYLILFNDHTDGTTPGTYTPQANVADNDLAVGQLVELISHSPIWSSSAVFVLEDDSQDGIDHVDAHRIPAFVASPYARRHAVVHTRYDQYSFLRTAEIIAGLKPLSLNDSLATPLYDAFISGSEKPEVEGTRFLAIQPGQSLTAVNPDNAPSASLSMQLPWDVTDTVPQRIADQILWRSVHGAGSTPPPAGPNASDEERARATGAMARYRAGRDLREFLTETADDD
jgi:DNA-binding beta-propeller fold protein YncE